MKIALVTLSTALAASLVATGARAAEVLGDEGARIVEESALVVWSAATRKNHVFFAAKTSRRAGVLVVSTPRGVAMLHDVPGVRGAFAALVPSTTPAPMKAEIGAASVLVGPRRASALCASRSLRCDEGLVTKLDGDELRGAVALELTPDGAGDAGAAGYVHWVFESEHPVAPFSDLAEAREVGGAGVLPPRLTTWVELGLDTKTGAWERKMDEIARGAEGELATCWETSAKGTRGEVHVQLRLGEGPPHSLGERVSSDGMKKLARCWAAQLERAPWPDPPRATTCEVHAKIERGRATRRVYRAYVLTTSDAEPRLGPGFEGAVPEGKLEASFEPELDAVTRAFGPSARVDLEIDPSRRHRLIVVSSTADPHPAEDLHFRALSLPPERPGETPLPIVEPGDRPDEPRATRSLLRRRWVKRAGAVGLVALIVAFALRAAREKAR